jgi:hypothetical protein
MMSNDLAAFALVASEYERTGDAIRGLTPLFIPIINEFASRLYDPNAFARKFSERYGLSMTASVAKALTERMVQAGLLVEGPPRIFHCVEFPDQIDGIDESGIEAVLDNFAAWVHRILDPMGKSLPRERIDAAFLERIARPEVTTSFLSGQKPSKLSLRPKKVGDDGWSEKQALDFLVPDYVLHIHMEAPELFNLVSQISFGALVADAVSALAMPKTSNNDPDLRAAMDGPLLLDALDLNSPEHTEYAKELLEQFVQAGFRLATFDHVIEEMRRTIRTTLEQHKKGEAFGHLAARLRTSAGHLMYATHVMDTLEERLKELDVSVLRSELYEETRFKRWFTESNFDSLRNALGDVHLNLERRITDAKSIATVIRMRLENRAPASVLKAGTTFVTRNAALAGRANQFLSTGRSEPDPRFTCVTDAQLVAITWFARNISAVSLSQKRLIASCAAAISPRPEIMKAFAAKLEELGGEHRMQFEALMRDERASLCPMRAVAGTQIPVAPATAERVLEEMKLAIARPLLEAERAATQASLEAEIQKRAAAEARATGSEATVGSVNFELASAQHEMDTYRRQLESVQKEQGDKKLLQQQSLDGRAAKLDRRTKKFVGGIKLVILVMAVTCFAAPFSSMLKDAKSIQVASAILGLGSFWFVTAWGDRAIAALARLRYKAQRNELRRWSSDMDLDFDD